MSPILVSKSCNVVSTDVGYQRISHAYLRLQETLCLYRTRNWMVFYLVPHARHQKSPQSGDRRTCLAFRQAPGPGPTRPTTLCVFLSVSLTEPQPPLRQNSDGDRDGAFNAHNPQLRNRYCSREIVAASACDYSVKQSSMVNFPVDYAHVRPFRESESVNSIMLSK